MLFKNEAEFNARMRAMFRHCGLQCLHIREADVPGPSDLVVWHGQQLVAWIELKIDNEEVRPSQKEFLRDRQLEGCLALVFRFRNGPDHIEAHLANQDKPFATVEVGDPDWFDRLLRWNSLFVNE